uniref:Uncharacterized protein n=1 Tax=Helianthus annuus TaxID=4232 RepID=A0A251RUJ5_HELAN
MVEKTELILKVRIWEDSKSRKILMTGRQDSGLYFVGIDLIICTSDLTSCKIKGFGWEFFWLGN